MHGAEDGARLWNPSCIDVIDVDLPYISQIAGALADAVDGRDACGGSCSAGAPFCDVATGSCKYPSCDDVAAYCGDSGESGVRARQICPGVCGCDDPRAPLALSYPRDGCGESCTRGEKYRQALDALPCEDVAVDDPNFVAFLDDWERAAWGWMEDIKVFSRMYFIPAFRDMGCGFLSWNPLEDPEWLYTHSMLPYVFGGNMCVEDASWFPIKPLSYFCPVACACASGDPHCPTSCPERRATNASDVSSYCPDYQRFGRDGLWDPRGNSTCPTGVEHGVYT